MELNNIYIWNELHDSDSWVLKCTPRTLEKSVYKTKQKLLLVADDDAGHENFTICIMEKLGNKQRKKKLENWIWKHQIFGKKNNSTKHGFVWSKVILFIAPESVDKPAEDDDRLLRKGRRGGTLREMATAFSVWELTKCWVHLRLVLSDYSGRSVHMDIP